MIVVIGILAALTIVAYNGIQRRAIHTTMVSDLSHTAKLMAAEHAITGVYPGVLPAEVRASPGVTLTLVSTPGGYSGLSPVQNGVLFQAICQEIINEGYGRGTNMGGGTEQYITACNVYNKNAMQINGWDAHDFDVPLTASSVYSWYNSSVSADSWRPSKKQVFLEFATELSARFTAAGGTFPVTSFWDNWASPGNGIAKETLPAPSSGASAESFCVQAMSVREPGSPWHVTNGGAATQGAC